LLNLEKGGGEKTELLSNPARKKGTVQTIIPFIKIFALAHQVIPRELSCNLLPYD
jgi:hypothetical protein